MTTNTLYKHIVVNEQGVLLIEGTTMKVVELVLNFKAYEWTPEEVQKNHPYLTLGQIYSVLAYYWDHKKSIKRSKIAFSVLMSYEVNYPHPGCANERKQKIRKHVIRPM